VNEKIPRESTSKENQDIEVTLSDDGFLYMKKVGQEVKIVLFYFLIIYYL